MLDDEVLSKVILSLGRGVRREKLREDWRLSAAMYNSQQWKGQSFSGRRGCNGASLELRVSITCRTCDEVLSSSVLSS